MFKPPASVQQNRSYVMVFLVPPIGDGRRGALSRLGRASVSRRFLFRPVPFVETVHLMTATGGSLERDLFEDPERRDRVDDYDSFADHESETDARRLTMRLLPTGTSPDALQLGHMTIRYRR